MTVREITPSIAPILEELELDQPRLVTAADVERVANERGSTASPAYLIKQLTSEGWLLPLRTRGVWEFAPAARAGAFGSGEAHIELRATLLKRPDLPVALAAESAAWIHGLSSREPTTHSLATPPSLRVPPALSGYRVLRHQSALEPTSRGGLPTWKVATLLVAMADRPSSYRDWPNVGDWLREAVTTLAEADLRAELEDKTRAAWARLAYLLSRGGVEDLAERLLTDAPAGSGPYYLGPREGSGVHDARFDVIDGQLVDFAQ